MNVPLSNFSFSTKTNKYYVITEREEKGNKVVIISKYEDCEINKTPITNAQIYLDI